MLCAARIPLTYFNTDLTLHVMDFFIIQKIAHSVIASTGIEHIALRCRSPVVTGLRIRRSCDTLG